MNLQMMLPLRTFLMAGALALPFFIPIRLQAADPDPFAKVLKPVFQQRCVKCHGAKGKVKGKVNLLKLQRAADLTGNPKLMSKLIEALDTEEMPPEKEPPLAPATRKQMTTHLRRLLHATVRARRQFAQTPIRRMNRFQYSNAIQDLFEMKRDVFPLPERMMREHGDYFQPQTGKMPGTLKVGSRPLGKSQLINTARLAGVTPFPQDLRAEHGFDNRGDHLSLSPLLLESFLKLSRSIVESHDFNWQNLRIWKSFFDAPPGNEDVERAVRDRLRGFLTRAFRRPVDDALLDRYAGHVLRRIKAGDSFTDGMKAAVSAAVASPRFLYLYDRASTGDKAEALDDFELASRLSFFLWGSIPDQALLDLAAAGRLHKPDVLSAQVDRMLKDRRLKRFCDSFPAQWLQLERIVASVPDPQMHPEFYFAKYRSSMHMMLEPLLVFETILIENRSILELIDSDFSYRSKLLKHWYQNGKRGGAGSTTALQFQRVPVTDRRQGGVITCAAVMTMTSSPVRSKPISRGAWMASVIFNKPPEPPPADVPPLPDDEDPGEKNLTIRERLSAHRGRKDCAGCHAKIDPLGFALENYGPTGIWRDTYANGRKVDVAGTLFRKHDFTSVVEFKDAILKEKDRFTRAFAKHLLSFALGREVGLGDGPALEKIVRETAANGYRMQPLIKQVVTSEPFLNKFNPVQSGVKQ